MWNEIHSLLINYVNNNITSDTKEVYQFDISGKISKEDQRSQKDNQKVKAHLRARVLRKKCSHCGRKGHTVDKRWWAPKTDSAGSSSDHQKQVYNIAAQSADHSVAIMPTDQFRAASQSTLLVTAIIVISSVLYLCLWARLRIQQPPAQNQPLHVKCFRRAHHGGQLQQPHL